MAVEAEYQLAPNIAGLPPIETLGETAAHLGRAVAYYTEALVPLITLTTGHQDTMQQQLDALDQDSKLRVHLTDAGQSLTAARSALLGQQLPASPSTPSAPLHLSPRRGHR
ncbi:hypothetical protein ACQPZG_31620 [Streptomyces sp. CA-294286]|uniref:hypothetical protein n=1 Tax=Streptomyces sp. CA-294286 TaxID=3240070 RepID=UPI003D923E73